MGSEGRAPARWMEGAHDEFAWLANARNRPPSRQSALDTAPSLFEQWCEDRIQSATPSPPQLRRQSAHDTPPSLFEQWCEDRIQSATPSPPQLRRQNATLGVEDHWGRDLPDFDRRMFFDVIHGHMLSHENLSAPAESAHMSVFEGAEPTQTEDAKMDGTQQNPPPV